MRLRLDRLSTAVRTRRTRALALLVGSIPLGLFGLVSFGFVAVSATGHSTFDWGAAGFCAVFGGAIPCLGAALLLLSRSRYERATRELQALFTEASADGRVDRAALEGKGWSRERADTVLLDALAHGLLEDDAGTSLRPPPIAAGGPAPWSPAQAWAPPTNPSVPAVASPIAHHAHGSPAVSPSAHAAPAPAFSTPAPAAFSTPAQGAAPGHLAAPTSAEALASLPPQDALAITRAARPRSDRPPAASSVITGRVLKGTYVVEEPLGQGGMGAVFAARHLRTGRRYAVKTLLSTERFSPDSILRFEREARAASAIGHAGIVGVHDFDRTDDGVHFLVMDLLAGETLEARLGRAGRLSWGEARQLVLETCDALAAAHGSGVLHRDLKPGNVFLAQIAGLGERAVLVDFGLAKPLEEGASQRVTSTGAVVGTALYMSPEQTRGERLDVRSDVYGLAAVIYETLTGVPPFLGPSALAVMTMVLAEQPVPPSMLARGLPAELDHALLGALAKNASDRPADVATLAAALSAIEG